jgi:diguanylate cyclase (GGDEF)-like protein
VLAERQARALADGDLTNPALSERAPGLLGASLQTAVQTLAESLDEREEFRARLAHEAAHDGLTSLPNRNASLAQLQRGVSRTRRNAAMLAVMFVDLDGFKDINDGQGHQAGDDVLREIAERLLRSVRDGDHVGRLGGDEFLVVAEPVSGVDEALRLAERLQAAVSQPTVINGRAFHVNASIGVALTDAASDLTADELLRDADLAVYKAKALGRGRIELCDEDLRSEVRRRAALESSLRRAIDGDGFDLLYQPVIDRRTGRTTAVEALIRWDTPGDGTMPPPELIELAERSDLIVDIDNWVIERVVRQLSEWDATAMSDVPISINISARHFGSERVVANILGAIAAAGVAPSRLAVELTESALLADLDSAAAKLQALRQAGIGSPSTTSAPATRRSHTCARCQST